MTERPLVFDCAGERLVGVLAEPATPARTGVVIIVGGPQYRAGSHRQFVLLARSLGEAGFAALRFDYRGMGDSEGAARRFDDVSADVSAAVAALGSAVPSIERFVLWGLCDGASAALMYVDASREASCRREGTRVSGLVLTNPWVRSDATFAKTRIRHYYLRRAFERAFWVKLLRGEVRIAASLGDLGRTAKTATDRELVNPGDARAAATESFRERMYAGFATFTSPVLLLMSDHDLTAREFDQLAASDRRWQMLLRRPSVTRVDIAGADHTFSQAAARQTAERATIDWLHQRVNRVTTAVDRSIGGGER